MLTDSIDVCLTWWVSQLWALWYGLVQHMWAASLRQGCDWATHSASLCRMQVLMACKT